MGSYIIKEGDTLANIASQFGTTVEDIAAANNIQNVNLIYAGEELNINIPQAAPTAQPVSTNNAVEEADLSEFAAPAQEAAPTPAAPAPAPAETYTVKNGDTLSQIARDHGTTVEELARLNNIPDVNRIYTGDVLVIRPETEAMQEVEATEVSSEATTDDNVEAISMEGMNELEEVSTETTSTTDTEVEAVQVEVEPEVQPAPVEEAAIIEEVAPVEVEQQVVEPTPVEEAATIEEVTPVEVEQPIVEPAPVEAVPATTYTVKGGDTLGAIALANGTTVEEIARLNNIENVNVIHTGDVLVLKSGVEAMQETPVTDVVTAATTVEEVAPVTIEETPTVEPVVETASQIQEATDNVEIGISDDRNKEGAFVPPITQLVPGNLKGVYTGQVLNKMNASQECRQASGVLTYDNKIYNIGTDTLGNTLSKDDYFYLVGQVAGEAGHDCDDMMGVCTTILNRLELGGFGKGGVKGVLQYGYWPFGKTCDKYIVYDGSGAPSRFRTLEELGPTEYAKLQNCINVVDDAMHGVRNLNKQTVYYFGDGQHNHFSDYV